MFFRLKIIFQDLLLIIYSFSLSFAQKCTSLFRTEKRALYYLLYCGHFYKIWKWPLVNSNNTNIHMSMRILFFYWEGLIKTWRSVENSSSKLVVIPKISLLEKKNQYAKFILQINTFMETQIFKYWGSRPMPRARSTKLVFIILVLE